ESGAIASVHIQGGAYVGGGLRFEINGTEGDLLISSNSPFGVTSPDIQIRGVRRPERAFAELPIPPGYARAPESLAHSPAFATAHLYLELEKAIKEGVEASPNFEEA